MPSKRATIAFTNGNVHFPLQSRKSNLQFWNNANNSKEKVEMELFLKDSVAELNTKKLGNSPSFLTITQTTLFAKLFRSYGILMIDVAAEFCFWAEQRQNG
jgi:hypothetical protein